MNKSQRRQPDLFRNLKGTCNGNSITKEDFCILTTRKSGTENAVDQANQALERKGQGLGTKGRNEEMGFRGKTVKRMQLRRGRQGIRETVKNRS